jgi:hypothetical protein
MTIEIPEWLILTFIVLWIINLVLMIVTLYYRYRIHQFNSWLQAASKRMEKDS